MGAKAGGRDAAGARAPCAGHSTLHAALTASVRTIVDALALHAGLERLVVVAELGNERVRLGEHSLFARLLEGRFRDPVVAPRGRGAGLAHGALAERSRG